MLIKPLPQHLPHPPLALEVPALRRGLAICLRATSRALQSLAERLASPPERPALPDQTRVLEFHAEAGAAEGALYVDGVLVAHLAGVRRL